MLKNLWNGFLWVLAFLVVLAIWSGINTIVDAPKHPHTPLAQQFVLQFLGWLFACIAIGVLCGLGWLVKLGFESLTGRSRNGDKSPDANE